MCPAGNRFALRTPTVVSQPDSWQLFAYVLAGDCVYAVGQCAALGPIGLLDTPPGEGGHQAGTCVRVRLLQPPIITILSAPPCFQQVFYLHVLFTYRVTLLGQHCALLGC